MKHLLKFLICFVFIVGYFKGVSFNGGEIISAGEDENIFSFYSEPRQFLVFGSLEEALHFINNSDATLHSFLLYEATEMKLKNKIEKKMIEQYKNTFEVDE